MGFGHIHERNAAVLGAAEVAVIGRDRFGFAIAFGNQVDIAQAAELEFAYDGLGASVGEFLIILVRSNVILRIPFIK